MDETAKAQERRVNFRLRQYWEKQRGNREFPEEGDIDPEELEGIWDACFLVKVRDIEGRQFRYSYMGDSLMEAYGDDLTGRDVYDRLVAPEGDISHKFGELIKTGKPLLEESEFVNRRGVRIMYRSGILPLGTEDGTITHILGGMRWKAV